jgi:riboflavin synthase
METGWERHVDDRVLLIHFMFTGIIETTGTLTSIEDLGGGIAFTIETSLSGELSVDDSISVNGVCLTVVHKSDNRITVQLVEETLRKTSLGSLSEGSVVNLERAMVMGARLDGHIVQGHVDTTGNVLSVQEEATGWLIEIGYPAEFSDYIIGRGSVAVDGISLTVARDLSASFTVAIIPYTREHTNLRSVKVGSVVNLEFDLIGKYVLNYLKNKTP